jgi:subtilisin family serine protease
MSTINTKFFSPSQLRTIREAVNGTGGGQFKINSATSSALKTLAKPADDLQDVLILGPEDSIFKSDIDLSESLEARGVKIGQDFDQMGATARLSAEKVAELKESGYHVFDNSPRPMWGLPGASAAPKSTSDDYSMPEVRPVEWLKADQVHQAGRTGAGQKVAVLDSGFQHPDFQLAGWADVVDHSPTPVDRVGHGTHVAHDVLQAAPNAAIIAVKVMGDDGSGRPSDIIAGIQYVLEQNAQGADIDIINMSLGGPPDGYPDELHPINRAVKAATEAGITVVAAAGNSGPGANTIGSPAEAAQAIAVGATLDPNTVSDFSSRGPTEGGLVKPDVMAPGEYIAAWSVPGSEMEQTAQAVDTLRKMPADMLKQLLSQNPELAQGLGLPPEVISLPADRLEKLIKPNLPPTYIPQPGLVAAPGTSFAAPLVSGVLATLEEEHDISPEASMALLRGTADTMGAAATIQGQGFVDAKEALDVLRKAKTEAGVS